MNGPLLSILLSAWGADAWRLGDTDGVAIESELVAMVARAKAPWPGVAVSGEDFVRHVAERLDPGSDLLATLREIRAADLFLAFACLRNNPEAFAHFERHYLSEAEPALRTLGISEAAIDEVKQVLRRRFFVEEVGASGGIGTYSGRGGLRSWVRAAAVRTAFRVVRRPKGQVEMESSVMRAVAAPTDDLELAYLKRRYAEEFEGALRQAFSALTPKDRNLLRYYYGEGLGIDGLAALYHVHRATAARWINRTTQTLMKATRRLLEQRWNADRSEVSSIVRLIQSRIAQAIQTVMQRSDA